MNGEIKQAESLIRCDEVFNDGISYKFSLTERRSEGAISNFPLYTVKVEMRDEDGISTAAIAENVFKGTDRAIEFYDKIVRNLATPIDLPYVVEDEMV